MTHPAEAASSRPCGCSTSALTSPGSSASPSPASSHVQVPHSPGAPSGAMSQPAAPLSEAERAAIIARFDSLTSADMRRCCSLKWKDPRSLTRSPSTAASPCSHAESSVAPRRTSLPFLGAWVAEMDLGVCDPIREILERQVRDGCLGYLSAADAHAAREATARYQRDAFGWDLDADAVSLAPDVLSCLCMVIDRHTPAGSAVIVPTPAYMPFLDIPGRYGREVIEVASRSRVTQPAGTLSWELDLDAIEAAMAAGAGCLVLCNPWNPAGQSLSRETLEAVATLSDRYGVTVFADEIHSPLVIDPQMQHIPYASVPRANPALTFTATAASKGWNIPGLKCAQLIATGAARERFESDPVSAHLSQEAAALGALASCAAYSPQGQAWIHLVRDYLWGNVQEFSRLIAEIPGVRMTDMHATYLAWVDLSECGLGAGSALTPAQLMDEHAALIVNDGVSFGRDWRSGMRVNLGTGRQIVEEIAERIAQAVSTL